MIAAVPDPAALATPQAARAWQAARKFEAMAIAQLLQPMFDTLAGPEPPFGGGFAEQAFQPFLTEAIADRMSTAGGLGLAMQVWRQMLRQQEDAP